MLQVGEPNPDRDEQFRLNLMQISHKVGRADGGNDFSNTLWFVPLGCNYSDYM